MAEYENAFFVGSSVDLFMQVSVPGTRDPADPAAVVLVSLKRTIETSTTDVTPADVGFEKVRDGLYKYRIEAGSLLAGTYRWVARAEDGQNGVAIDTDVFVMVALP